jgi:hypothetical protein
MTVKIIRQFLVVPVAWFFLAAIPAFAQSVLPASFTGWTAANNSSPADGKPRVSAPDLVAREYGLVSVERTDYTHGKDTLGVSLYKMKDPSGAYGLYSFLRSPEMAHSEPGDHSVVSRERALLLDGNLVLDVTGSDLPKYGADLNTLVVAVTPKAQQGPLPSLTEHLPSKGFVERSDKYVLGPVTLNEVFPVSADDWLGFSHGAEAEVAKYNVNGHEIRLLIADFPTTGLPLQPQESGREFDAAVCEAIDYFAGDRFWREDAG